MKKKNYLVYSFQKLKFEVKLRCSIIKIYNVNKYSEPFDNIKN